MAGLRSNEVIKAPNPQEKQNFIAIKRARKLYEEVLTKKNRCIMMDDETYIKVNVKLIPGLNYYVSNIQGNVDDKFKFVYCDKITKKLMIWQVICICGLKGEFFGVPVSINPPNCPELRLNEKIGQI